MSQLKHRTSQRQSNVHSPERRDRTLRNQLTDLIINGKLVTNHTKAKTLQSKIEKLITKAKVDSVHNRRQAAKVLYTKESVQKLFIIAKKYNKRNGGYTRVLKFGTRKGDASKISIILFV